MIIYKQLLFDGAFNNEKRYILKDKWSARYNKHYKQVLLLGMLVTKKRLDVEVKPQVDVIHKVFIVLLVIHFTETESRIE